MRFTKHWRLRQRVCAMLLCAAMLFGLTSSLSLPEARAEGWSDPYIDQLSDWGIMRGDERGMSPERAVTRAEFVAMINRAFGYTQDSGHPFKDVLAEDWYDSDIGIAYTAGYFNGTGDNNAAPRNTLSREEAATLICRNLMLQPSSGEDLSFTDSRLTSSWSRGYIKAAAEEGILTGYDDGTFRPKNDITRAEVAAILSRVIGTPIQEEGTYSDSVSGNLTVSTSGVTLENMTISGDLFITPGVGLGYVTLNNVDVLGKIIASGTGESNKGDTSIILKNSSAPEMIIDSPKNVLVSVRTVGSTEIETTYVRTDAYIEDKSRNRYGLQQIIMDGEEQTRLDLAGNIHEVIDKSPRSTVTVGSGTVESMTIDEEAPNSVVNIEEGALVEEMNLDVGATVNGEGDIGTLHVNASGCRVEMVPDEIVIRPGLTATIAGVVMSNLDGSRSSQNPRILSGYPRTQDIAPTQATVAYKTNKTGTIYWAVRLSGEGEMDADDLIDPPSYGANIVKSGNIKSTDVNKTLSQKVSGLKLDTSYVLSAVLVDSRDDESDVKSIYFTTPDNSKPAFASGYPTASNIEDTYADFDVAATKTCTLYWAVFKKGMDAPTANEFKDNTISGAIDSGKESLKRSEEDTIIMGDNDDIAHRFEELGEYDAYFFLTDGVNDSAIKKVSFTTADRTAPEFRDNYPRISKVAAKALTVESMINEDGKVYWAAVKHGVEYPVTSATLTDPEDILLDQQLQIRGGLFAAKAGSSNAKEDTVSTINISGLDAETAYDIYFIAEDAAGNLSAGERAIVKVEGKTLDSNAPVVISQTFSQIDVDGNPLADSDVILTFSEDVYDSESGRSLVEIFQDSTTNELWYSIILNNFELRDLSAKPQESIDWEEDDKVTKANAKQRVTARLDENGCTVLTFTNAAMGLKSGNRYQFYLSNIRDQSNNRMGQNYAVDPAFQTVYAQVRLMDAEISDGAISTGEQMTDDDGNPVYDEDGNPVYKTTTVEFDMSFIVDPVIETTQQMPATVMSDLIFASNTNMSFTLYGRSEGEDNWHIMQTNVVLNYTPSNAPWLAVSLNYLMGYDRQNYVAVRDMEYTEYAIEFTKINGSSDSTAWDADVSMYIMCAAGSAVNLNNLNRVPFVETTWNTNCDEGRVTSIGSPNQIELRSTLRNTQCPNFQKGYPRIYTGDSIANVNVMLDRVGTIHWVVAKYQEEGKTPEPALPPREMVNGSLVDIPLEDISEASSSHVEDLPEAGILLDDDGNERLSSPNPEAIISKMYGGIQGIQQGDFPYNASNAASIIRVTDLEPNTTYIAYFVLQGSSNIPSSVYCFQFTTGDVIPPVLTISPNGSNATITIKPNAGQESVDAHVYWWLYNGDSTTAYPGILNEKYYIPGTSSSKISALAAMLDEQDQSRFNDWGSLSDDEAEATEYKQRLWDYLTGPSNAAYSPPQSGEFSSLTATTNVAGQVTVIDSDKLLRGTNYLLIVAVQNNLGGPYIFGAVQNIRRTDGTGPLVKSIMSSGKENDDGTYTGTAIITFTDRLYMTSELDEDDEADDYPLGIKLLAVIGSSTSPPRDRIALSNIITATSGTISVTAPTSNTATSTFTVKYKKVSPGGGFVIYASDVIPGLLADEYGNARNDNPEFYLILVTEPAPTKENPDATEQVPYISLSRTSLVTSEVS